MISTQDVAATIGAYTQSARFRASHCTPLALQLARVAPAALTDDQRKALDTAFADLEAGLWNLANTTNDDALACSTGPCWA